MSKLGLLNVESRTETSTPANKRLRETGYIPGNIYGRDMDSVAVSIRKDELRKSIAQYGRSAVFELIVDGDKKYNVMVKDIQFTHLQKDLMHVDFHSISLTEETRANVPVRAIGSELLEAQRLVVQIQRDSIPVRGLPQDVPNFIDIDVTEMEIGDTVFLEDIELPEGIESDLDETQLILSVVEAMVHKEEDDEEAEVDADEMAEEETDDAESTEEEDE